MAGTADFSTRLLDWAARHGRHDLPWQQRPTPYRVWVSEIMLQQTQVATVIPYYRRFMGRFPGVRALADAHEDDVLSHWSGLGYYARARNLHRAAKLVRDQHGGRFPRTLDAVQALPGIGRSTAGAILSLALNQPHPILDGNVKRVLARHGGIEGWPGSTAVAKSLWQLAETHLPDDHAGRHNQALMDLGATVCLATAPHCLLCPVGDDCRARRSGRTDAIPGAKPRKTLPQRHTVFLLLRDGQGRLLFERRPPAGIWGGLWGPPECADASELAPTVSALGLALDGEPQTLPPVRHGFSHYRLEITPLLATVRPRAANVADETRRWVAPDALDGLGLAAPVARLVASLAATEPEEDR